jgi:predicted metal-dependent hydrolase
LTESLQNLLESTYRELRPRAPLPEFQLSFYPFANINCTIRLREGVLKIRLSDLLEGAPEAVLHSILHILIAKIYRKPIDATLAARYRRYVGGQDLTRKAQLVRQMRGRKNLASAAGRVYNLEEIFEELNLRFFHGLMARPRIAWSASRARNMLGHYDPAHNAIVVSRVFDHPNVPRYAVEYIVYHEMLHLRHPVKLRGSRRLVHPAEFKAEEKLFPQLAEARAFLKRL